MISVIVEDRYIIISMHRRLLCQVPPLHPASQPTPDLIRSSSALHHRRQPSEADPPSGAPQSPTAREKVKKNKREEKKQVLEKNPQQCFLSFPN